MKATVDVCRIGYAHEDIEVEIPDRKLKGMTRSQVEKALKRAALEKAGNVSFSENDADYQAESVQLTGECPSCGGQRPLGRQKPGSGLFDVGSECPHCGHVEPKDTGD